MNVTLNQIARIAPEVAGRVREAIRDGRIKAERQQGVAGRPYVIETEALVKLDRTWEPVVRRLEAGDVPAGPMPSRSRRGRAGADGSDGSWSGDAGHLDRLITLMEAQAAMLRTLMDQVTRDRERKEDRLDRMQEELTQLSYKLGQAHQEIARLERHVAERRLPRAEEA
ncbi:MAG: hypothetical protein K6V97_07490 [Actinomycetia bacterium]|nr:hypothetical protein [Actinomycetes bacterium]